MSKKSLQLGTYFLFGIHVVLEFITGGTDEPNSNDEEWKKMSIVLAKSSMEEG